MKFNRRSERAGWAKCIEQSIPGSGASSQSKFSLGPLQDFRRTPMGVVHCPDVSPALNALSNGCGRTKSLQSNIQPYDSAAFFPDGTRILACGSESEQPSRCYVQELAGGTARAVTPQGASYGLISPDGKSILAREGDGDYWIYPMEGDETKHLSGITRKDEVVHWSSDGQSVLIHRLGEVPAQIERLNLSTGKRTAVMQLSPPSRAGVTNVRHIVFSQDERSYAYTFDKVLCRLASVSGVK